MTGKNIALDTIRLTVLWWAEFDKAQRDREGLETTDDTHILCPPTWPSHGMLKNWAAALEDASKPTPCEKLKLAAINMVNTLARKGIAKLPRPAS